MCAVFLLEVLPGNALSSFDGALSGAQEEALNERLGLDRTSLERVSNYAIDIVRGDLGRSLVSGEAVNLLVLERAGPTIALAGAALGVVLLVALPLGIVAAVTRSRYVAQGVQLVTATMIAIPPFWAALLLIAGVAVRFRSIPTFGSGTAAHLFLPSIVAALPLIPGTTRMVRGALLRNMGAPYVVAAIGRGVGLRRLILRHIAPGVGIDLLSYTALQAIHLVSSVAVIETVFGRPGLARLAIDAALQRDGPVLVGAILAMTVFVLTLMATVDLVRGVIDPRSRR